MRNYIRLGPIAIKISSKNIAFWGYPRLQIGGYSFWSWCNTGEFCPASYHPGESLTWLWTTRIARGKKRHSYTHNSGGTKAYWLPFGWQLIYSWQHPMWKKDLTQ